MSDHAFGIDCSTVDGVGDRIPFESDCKAKFDRDRIVNNSTGKLKMDTGRDVVRVLRPCFHGGALCDVWILHNSDNSGGF